MQNEHSRRAGERDGRQPGEITRRQFPGRSDALALGAGMGLWTRSGSAASAPDVEAIEVTPKLVEAAKREGDLVVRYGVPGRSTR